MQPSRPSRTTPFLSTLSLRRATLMWWQSNTTIKISIHALLAESDSANLSSGKSITISIHALLAESDGESVDMYKISKQISIHALLAESDSLHHDIHAALTDFYPRSPCGERQHPAADSKHYYLFLSTLSLRRATQIVMEEDMIFEISIHALLAESDSRNSHNINRGHRISIHALLAESDVMYALIFAGSVLFLSTLSLRRATAETAITSIGDIEFLSTLSLRRAT